jgi:hypothetical protein
MLDAAKTAMEADRMPIESIRKGGNTKAASTAADPLSRDNSPRLLDLAIAQSILIQLVVVMEVQVSTPITLTPNKA